MTVNDAECQCQQFGEEHSPPLGMPQRAYRGGLLVAVFTLCFLVLIYVLKCTAASKNN